MAPGPDPGSGPLLGWPAASLWENLITALDFFSRRQGTSWRVCVCGGGVSAPYQKRIAEGPFLLSAETPAVGSKGEPGHRACQPPPESRSQQCERLWAPEGGEKGGWEDEAPSQMNNQMFIYAASHLQEPGRRPEETRPAPWPPSALFLASTPHLDAEVWSQLQRWAAIGHQGGSVLTSHFNLFIGFNHSLK